MPGKDTVRRNARPVPLTIPVLRSHLRDRPSRPLMFYRKPISARAPCSDWPFLRNPRLLAPRRRPGQTRLGDKKFVTIARL